MSSWNKRHGNIYNEERRKKKDNKPVIPLTLVLKCGNKRDNSDVQALWSASPTRFQDLKKKLVCRGTRKKQSAGMQHSRIEGIMIL